MTQKLEQRIQEKLNEPTKRIVMFEKNWVLYINQNVMGVVRFYSGPVKLTLAWLDRIDHIIRQHLANQGLAMKRGTATSRLYMKTDDMGVGLKVLLPCISRNWSGSSCSSSGEPSSEVIGSGGWRRLR